MQNGGPWAGLVVTVQNLCAEVPGSIPPKDQWHILQPKGLKPSLKLS